MMMQTEQLNLFKPVPRYREYADKYLSAKDSSTWSIIYLFKKHCGEDGVLNPCNDSVKDKIFRDLENYGLLGGFDDVVFRKWLYKHIVNMFWYVTGREENIQPIQHWTEQISI